MSVTNSRSSQFGLSGSQMEKCCKKVETQTGERRKLWFVCLHISELRFLSLVFWDIRIAAAIAASSSEWELDIFFPHCRSMCGSIVCFHVCISNPHSLLLWTADAVPFFPPYSLISQRFCCPVVFICV